jgi:hypothetical protein
MFTAVTILALVAAGLVLAFRRFKTQRAATQTNLLYAAVVRDYGRWLTLRVLEPLLKPSPARWAAWFKGLGVWRLPVFERWLLAFLYGSFLYLAASGFFFAIFIRRGLYGFPLLLHVVAGLVFAACLTLAAFMRGRDYAFNPRAVALPADLKAVGKISVKPRDLIGGFFWLFVLAGFSLAVSALLAMLPWFHYQGQVLLYEWHRWSALVSLLAALAFADLELLRPRPAAA